MTKSKNRTMKKVWILGAGKFGQIAAEALRRKHAEAEITMVEKSSAACRQLANINNQIICRDGIEFLNKNLKNATEPDWIVPVIPVHVAFEWIKTKIPAEFRLEKITVPGQLIKAMPNPCQGKNRTLYVSYADFICPDNCPQPKNKCTFTGKPRPANLYEILGSLSSKGVESIVVRSWQLSPGVGGYKPRELFRALEKVLASKKPVALSTACSCHGVIDAFKIMPRQ
jgi:hypothetical protein